LIFLEIKSQKTFYIFYSVCMCCYSCSHSIDCAPQLLSVCQILPSCHTRSCLTVDHGPSSHSGNERSGAQQMTILSTINVSMTHPGSHGATSKTSSPLVTQVHTPSSVPEAILVQNARTVSYDLKRLWKRRVPNAPFH
jgi:hypothetical protein